MEINMTPTTFRAIVIAKALEFYADKGFIVNSEYTPTNMIKAANYITGHVYRRGQYRAAALALREWADRQGD
jgi:hypothetical protein